MSKRAYIALFFIAVSQGLLAQRIHLEIGGTLGFKDEFHTAPAFDTTSRYTEFHIYDLTAFARASKRNFGSEIGLGFEKAANYFVRRFDNSTQLRYMQLNRFYVDVSPYVYLVKKPIKKWDLQFGLRNYFNLTNSMAVPEIQSLRTWKLAGRVTTNFTYKAFLVGLYFEHDLRSDYYFKPNVATFGIRSGVIF